MVNDLGRTLFSYEMQHLWEVVTSYTVLRSVDASLFDHILTTNVITVQFHLLYLTSSVGIATGYVLGGPGF